MYCMLCTEKRSQNSFPAAGSISSRSGLFSRPPKSKYLRQKGFKTRQSSLFQRRIGCQMQSRSMMSSAKPTNATLFGSRRDVSALKKVPSPSATKKAQRQRFLQPIDAAAGKEFRAWDDAKNSKKRTDLKKIMIIGAGPIVIGQVIRIYLHRIHILRSLPRSS